MATFVESAKVSSSVSEPYRMIASAIYTPIHRTREARKHGKIIGLPIISLLFRCCWLPGSSNVRVHELKREARAIGDDTLPWLAFLAVAFVRSDFHSDERQDRPRRRFAVIVPSAGALDRLPIAVGAIKSFSATSPRLRSCPSCIFFRSSLLSLSLL